MNNQLQLAINVLEDMIERVDIQAYESPNSEDRVYAGHKWNAFIEARRAMLAVVAIDTLAAICRAAAPSAPDTAASFKVGDRVQHHDGACGTVTGFKGEWIGVSWDGGILHTEVSPVWLTHHFDDLPQPSPTADYVYPDHPDLLATMHALKVLDEAELCSLCGKVHRPLSEPCDQPQPSPAPPLGSETPSQPLNQSTLKDVSAAKLSKAQRAEITAQRWKLNKVQEMTLQIIAGNMQGWAYAGRYGDINANVAKALLRRELVKYKYEWDHNTFELTDAGRAVLARR